MTDIPVQSRAPVERIAPDTIRLERELEAPVDKVWRYLTEAELRREWFMGGTDAQPGGEFELLNDHDNLSEDDIPYPENYAEYKGRGVEREGDPLRAAAAARDHVPERQIGTVTYELFPEGERTRLVLTHSGIQSGTGAQDFGSGWNSHLTALEEKLAGRSVRDFWSLHAQSREAVAKALSQG